MITRTLLLGLVLVGVAAAQCSIPMPQMKLPDAEGSMLIIKPAENATPMPQAQVPAPPCPKEERMTMVQRVTPKPPTLPKGLADRVFPNPFKK